MSKPGEPPKQVGKSKEVQREEPPTVEPAGLLPSADDDAWLDAETFDSLVSSVADEIEDESEEDIEEDIEEESQGSDEPISEMELSEDTENEVAVEYLSDDFYEPIKDARQHPREEPTVKVPILPPRESVEPPDDLDSGQVSSESGEMNFDSMTEMSFEIEFDSNESRREARPAHLQGDDDEDSLDLSMQAVLPSVMEQDTDIPNDKLLDLLAVVQEIHRAANRDAASGEEPQAFRVGSIETSRRGDVVRTRLDVPPIQFTVELAYGAMSVSTIALDVEFASVEAPLHQQLPANTADYRSLQGDEGHFSQIRFERDRGVADEVFGVLSQDALAEVHRFACEVIAMVQGLDT